MALKTRKADPTKPMRVIIYGIEGVGKSTLGALADNPVFIAAEGGADNLRDKNGELVDILEDTNNWAGIRKRIRELIDEDHNHKTLVIDSIDWLESIAHAHILATSNSQGKSISTVDGGYGAGFRKSAEMHKSLIEDLETLRNKKKMHIVMPGHYHIKDVKDPEATSDYNAFEIKCHEFVSSLWREWADVIAFARFTVDLKTDEGSSKTRALSDGSRVVYCQKQPAFQAKNRYGMKAEYVFDQNFWNVLKDAAYKAPADAEFKEMVDLIVPLLGKISDEEIKTAFKQKLTNAKKDVSELRKIKTEIESHLGVK